MYNHKHKDCRPATDPNQWLDIRDARVYLGRGYSRTSVFRKITHGELIEHIHFVRISPRSLRLNSAAIQAEWPTYFFKPSTQ